MSEKPILFNGAMVRSILCGRKTQTRRKFDPRLLVLLDQLAKAGECFPLDDPRSKNSDFVKDYCPMGQVGDRLWVRESFRTYDKVAECTCGNTSCGCPESGTPFYRATDDCKGVKWKPSIHMPRSISRINLEIVDIRFEKVKGISLEDAQAEGVFEIDRGREGDWASLWGWCETMSNAQCSGTPQQAFKDLWIQTYGENDWSANHWVWVIEFKKVD